MPGNNANYYTDGYTTRSSRPYYTTVVGEFQNSDSPYGTFDQGGNVWEWNEAIIVQFVAWVAWRVVATSTPNYLAASYRNNDYPTYEDYAIGFRVASVPEPGSIALLVCGLVSLICRRRRK